MERANQSAVIVTVPGAEPVVSRHREAFDVVLWLAPEPSDRFRALTDAVTRAFPEYPPYEGEFDEVVPHLTVGHTGTPEQLVEIERQVLPRLPVHMEVTAAELWCGSPAPGAWQRVADLPLG